VFQQIECRLPDDVMQQIQGDHGADINRLRALVGTTVDLRIDGGTLVMRWTDEPADPAPWQAKQAIDALAAGYLSEISVPHTGPLDVAARQRAPAETPRSP
jgi:hypothetical protein